MGDGAWLGWGALVVSFIGSGGLVGWAVNFLNNRTTRERDWYDQLQEDRKNDREQLSSVNNKVTTLMDYVEELRQHISEGKPPPPPKFPESLRTPL